jgi:ABC-2 type transport system ATP-binding protein
MREPTGEGGVLPTEEGGPSLRLEDDARRAIASGSPVVSYIGRDGFPQIYMPASVQLSGDSRLLVSVDHSDGAILGAVEGDPRVAVFCRDPVAGTTYHITGRASAAAWPEPDGVVVVLERVEARGRGDEVRGAPAAKASPAPVAGPRVLEVAGLSIYYGAKRAVNNLSLQVMRGEIFGLLGPNGAGKTSTLSAIEGLLKPHSGTVWLDGTDVLHHPIEAKAKMGVQLQATSFQSRLTIKQVVRLFAGLYGVAMSDTEVASAIASIGLEAEAGKPFKQLSGGQQQRLSLYVAVIHRPVLLLLDEPTAGLDPQARRQLWGRIESLRHDGGSILLTTHSMEEAQAVCDRVAIMDHGEILTCGSPTELIALHRDDPAVRAVAHGEVTLDDVFVGLTGSDVRD